MNKAEAIKKLHATLKDAQKEMFKRFMSFSAGRKYIIHSSRRLGKSYLLCVLAIMFALNKPNSQIRYASVTQKSVRKMIHPIMKDLFTGLTENFKGKWNSVEGAYVFKNGSMIHVAGVNNGHEDDLRGTAADLAIVDEAAFVDNLEYLVESVLVPQLITTNGKLIMASSSPLTPAHQFATYIHAAREGGYYSSFDITQGGYTPAIVVEFLKECGGPDSTTARREYFNELIVDEKMAIIPEWSDEFVKEIDPPVVRGLLHNYCSMDIGVRDKTAILWGYYDFPNARLIIEDEFTIAGEDTTTKNIAAGIKAKELALSYEKVYRRIADNNNLILLQDLASDYKLSFGATNKESLASMINDVRLLVQDGRVIVHPRCTQLIGCLTYGVYQDEKREKFGRSPIYGHYDALASLIYLVRNLDKHSNPIPATYGYNLETTRFRNQSKHPEHVQQIANLFHKPTKAPAF
jgi:hypothetical protein